MSEQVMHFFGVRTAGSLAHHMFPHWANVFGVQSARLEGVDIPLNAPMEQYRAVVEHLKGDSTVRGALVTSHKLNVVRAASDLIDRRTVESQLCSEVSALYKRGGALWGHACDPADCGRAMEQFLGSAWWQKHPNAAILSFGTGGATVAMVVYLLIQARARPKRIVLVDIDQKNLDHCRSVAEMLCPAGLKIDFVLSRNCQANDALVSKLEPHSLVINATGMGKDLPGSPITNAAVFPEEGAAWELNYRGERLFLKQARRQIEQRGLLVEDGRYYFKCGWSSVMGCVFNVPVTDALFAEFSAATDNEWPTA